MFRLFKSFDSKPTYIQVFNIEMCLPVSFQFWGGRMMTCLMWVFTPRKPDMAQISYLFEWGWERSVGNTLYVCMSFTGKRLHRFQGFSKMLVIYFWEPDVSVFKFLTELVQAIYLVFLISFSNLWIRGHDTFLEVSLELNEIMLLKLLGS